MCVINDKKQYNEWVYVDSSNGQMVVSRIHLETPEVVLRWPWISIILVLPCLFL